jgi:hypothetical protein
VNRRRFLSDSAGLAAAAMGRHLPGGTGAVPSANKQVRVRVDPGRVLGRIPDDFTGLGYEISSVATPGLLTAKNRTYVQLVRTLGARGVIRVGGNTSDYSSFAPHADAVSSPKATVVNEASLQDLGTFLDATGWKLIWGLNLGGGNEQNAIEEAQAVMAAAKDKLLAFEIGNEPDLFGGRGTAHRAAGYDYQDYLKEYRRYKAAIRARLPTAPFAGPDAASATEWVTRFAADEGKDLKLLTHHYYRECASPRSTLDKLLNTDPKLGPELEKLRAASAAARVPYRICETNSFCGGGKPGVSDTFGAALWALDYMFTLTWADATGVNMETGVNQLGFISSYSPIGDNEHGMYSAKPEYYGMLAFSQASRGRRVGAECDASGMNLKAYPVLGDNNRLWLTLINKEVARDAEVSITVTTPFSSASVCRLTAPSVESVTDVTLAGAPVTSDGHWRPAHRERARIEQNVCDIHVPAASAALLTFEG